MARAQQNFHRHRTSSHGISLGGKDKIDGRTKAGREKKEEEERMKAIHEECNQLFNLLDEPQSLEDFKAEASRSSWDSVRSSFSTAH
jgi:hypothetical protein